MRDMNKLIGDIFWYIEKNDRVNLRKILFLIYFNDSMVYKMTYNLKQQRTNKAISICSNSHHLEWREGLLDKILKGDHPRTIPAKFDR